MPGNPDLFRQDIGPPIRTRMRGYLLCKHLEFGVAGRLRRQLSRELTLPAGANPKYDVPTRNCERNPASKIDLDHRKREIHAGRDACGSPNAAILDMDGVAVDDHGRTKALESVNLGPMGCCSSAIQNSGSSQEKRSAAHRCDAGHSADEQQ